MNTKLKPVLISIIALFLFGCPIAPFLNIPDLNSSPDAISVSENETFNIYLARGTNPKADWRVKTPPDSSIASFIEQFDDIAFPSSTGYRFKSNSAGQTSVIFSLVQDDKTLKKTVQITVNKSDK